MDRCCNKTKISFNENPIKVASKQKENPCEKFVFAVCGEGGGGGGNAKINLS